jgi:hypothetical protein
VITVETRRLHSLTCRGTEVPRAASRSTDECNGDYSPVDGKAAIQLLNVTTFSNWPEWLKLLVFVPHGILASVTCFLWWPKSQKEWRRFGFVTAYLLVFALVMRFVFQMKDFK